jgi:hypothetical protein
VQTATDIAAHRAMTWRIRDGRLRRQTFPRT